MTSNAVTLTVNSTGVTTLAGWPDSAGSINGVGRAARFGFVGAVRTDTSGNIYVADPENDLIRRKSRLQASSQRSQGQQGSLAQPMDQPQWPFSEGSEVSQPMPLGIFTLPTAPFFHDSKESLLAENGEYPRRTRRNFSSRQPVPVHAARFSDSAKSCSRFKRKRLCRRRRGLHRAQGHSFGRRHHVGRHGRNNRLRRRDNGRIVRDTDRALAVDASGNLYLADNSNNTIRKVTAAGVVSTVAGLAGRTGSTDGTGTQARFNGPGGLAVDSSGNIYVADSFNDTIREISPAGVVTTLAGSAEIDENIDGLALQRALLNTQRYRQISTPSGILYVADGTNFTVRRIVVAAGTPPTITTQPQSQTVTTGASVTFSVVANGAPPLTYQWYLNGVAISGATSASYSIGSVQTANLGSYTVSVSGSGGAVLSSVATLAFGASLPVIVTQPLSTATTW